MEPAEAVTTTSQQPPQPVVAVPHNNTAVPGFSVQRPSPSAASPTPSKRPTLVTTTLTNNMQQQQHTDLRSLQSGQVSPQGSSDFERCSLDYEPTSSAEFDHHSSEEELAIINCRNKELHPEKRKWSQMTRCSSYSESSGSSDDEVRELLCRPQPVDFRSSPPRGVHKISRTMSPKLFLANVTPVQICTVSPRKRHRQTSSTDVSDAMTVIQRPCLDFEKMQVGVITI